MDFVMKIKQEVEDIDEIDNATIAKLDNSYSHISHANNVWDSFKTEKVDSSKYGEHDIVTPAFEYIEVNKTVLKDEIDMERLDQKVDLCIKIESSASTNETCDLPLKGLKNEPIMENEESFELTIDNKEYIKVERDMLAVDQISEAYRDSPKLQGLTEELDIKPNIDISNDENLSAESAGAAKKKIKGAKHRVIQRKPDKGSLICHHCDYIVHSKKDFIHHINVGKCSSKSSVKKKQSKKYTCMNCHKNFKSKQAIDDHVIRNHEESIASVSSKIHQCEHCSYKTIRAENLVRHMTEHPETGCSVKQISCMHCNKTFKGKRALGDHIIKNHEEFIGSISSKIHRCEHCSYKTIYSSSLADHMTKHPEAGYSTKQVPCFHCDATFKKKSALDDHIIKNHEEFIGSVSSKIHQCEHCSYKTTYSCYLAKHIRKHPETQYNAREYSCICDAKFRSKESLDDHIIKNHEEFTASVSCKVHQCKHCSYKTTKGFLLTRHMGRHSEPGSSNREIPCVHCDATFKSKIALHDHVIKNHPEHTASVSSKIHHCEHCSYITTISSHFARHLAKHP